jgi:hypothetical protein
MKEENYETYIENAKFQDFFSISRFSAERKGFLRVGKVIFVISVKPRIRIGIIKSKKNFTRSSRRMNLILFLEKIINIREG